MFRKRKQREKVWKDEGMKVVRNNIITSMLTSAKAPVHLLEEESIKDNGKLYLQSMFGSDTLSSRSTCF